MCHVSLHRILLLLTLNMQWVSPGISGDKPVLAEDEELF